VKGLNTPIYRRLQHPDLSMDNMTPEQFVKWQKGNEIWAPAVIQTTNDSLDPSSPHPFIASVLEQCDIPHLNNDGQS
jgi:hypothetical protein